MSQRREGKGSYRVQILVEKHLTDIYSGICNGICSWGVMNLYDKMLPLCMS
jgi:hypothetical protein